MRKKDFEAIGASVNDMRRALPRWPGMMQDQQTRCIDSMARDLATILAKQNPRFDRQRFLTTCGVVSP